MSQAPEQRADTAGALATAGIRYLAVPLLLTGLGWAASQMHALSGEAVVQRLQVETLRRDAQASDKSRRDDSDTLRASLAEAIRRGEQARADLAARSEARDASQDKALAEMQGAIANGREVMARLGAQLDGVKSALDRIEGLLQRPAPAAASRTPADRIPPGTRW